MEKEKDFTAGKCLLSWGWLCPAWAPNGEPSAHDPSISPLFYRKMCNVTLHTFQIIFLVYNLLDIILCGRYLVNFVVDDIHYNPIACSENDSFSVVTVRSIVYSNNMKGQSAVKNSFPCIYYYHLIHHINFYLHSIIFQFPYLLNIY